MEKQRKIEFVNELINGMKAEIVGNIESNTIPADWDGVELREYIADYSRRQIAYMKMPRGRKSAYKDAVVINKL